VAVAAARLTANEAECHRIDLGLLLGVAYRMTADANWQ